MDKYGIGEAYNTEWEKDWKDVISTDQHFDGDYLIRLIVHKLSLMEKYFRDQGDESADTIDMCYNLGLKILTFNYGAEADKIFEEKGKNFNWFWIEDSLIRLVDQNNEDFKLWNELSDKAAADREADTKRFFKLISDNISNWWF